MSVNRLTLAGILFLGAGVSAPGHAQEAYGLQPLASVRQSAERALQREIGTAVPGVQLEAVALDPRLRLPACTAPLVAQAQAPRGSQPRVSVRVACAQGAAWSVNVPVQIHRELDVF